MFIALCFSCCDCSRQEFHFALSKARSNFNWRLLAWLYWAAPGLFTCIVVAVVIAVASYWSCCCWLRFTVSRRTLVEPLRDFFMYNEAAGTFTTYWTGGFCDAPEAGTSKLELLFVLLMRRMVGFEARFYVSASFCLILELSVKSDC